MSDEKKDAYDNLMSFVNQKNFDENKNLSREDIFNKYDNTPKHIAKLPEWLNKFFNSGNGFINCGKAYMIDHMIHHHPTTPLPLYRRIQYILDRAKDFYFDSETGAFCLVEEYGNKKGKPCKNFLIFGKDENGNLILHKTFYDTTKKIPKKFKKYSLADIQQGLTSEMVEHTIIGRSEDNSAPARGSISGRSDNSTISQSEDLSSKKDINSLRKIDFGNIPSSSSQDYLKFGEKALDKITNPEAKKNGGLSQDEFNKLMQQKREINNKGGILSPTDVERLIKITEIAIEDMQYEINSNDNQVIKNSSSAAIVNALHSLNQLHDWFDLSNGKEKYFNKQWKDYLEKHPEKFINGADNSRKTYKSIDEVKKAYQGTDKWLKAPNGKDTKLTEKQWCEVRTENFKRLTTLQKLRVVIPICPTGQSVIRINFIIQ